MTPVMGWEEFLVNLHPFRVGFALVPDDAGNRVMVQGEDARFEVVAGLVGVASRDDAITFDGGGSVGEVFLRPAAGPFHD